MILISCLKKIFKKRKTEKVKKYQGGTVEIIMKTASFKNESFEKNVLLSSLLQFLMCYFFEQK